MVVSLIYSYGAATSMCCTSFLADVLETLLRALLLPANKNVQ